MPCCGAELPIFLPGSPAGWSAVCLDASEKHLLPASRASHLPTLTPQHAHTNTQPQPRPTYVRCSSGGQTGKSPAGPGKGPPSSRCGCQGFRLLPMNTTMVQPAPHPDTPHLTKAASTQSPLEWQVLDNWGGEGQDWAHTQLQRTVLD